MGIGSFLIFGSGVPLFFIALGLGVYAWGRGYRAASAPLLLAPFLAVPVAMQVGQIVSDTLSRKIMDETGDDFAAFGAMGDGFLAMFVTFEILIALAMVTAVYLRFQVPRSPKRSKLAYVVAAAMFCAAGWITVKFVGRELRTYMLTHHRQPVPVPTISDDRTMRNPDQPMWVDSEDRFSMVGYRILTEDEELGIVNGHVTCGVSKHGLGHINGLWAPPFVSSDFSARWQVGGFDQRFILDEWRPAAITGEFGEGLMSAWNGKYTLTLTDGSRALVQALRFESYVDRPETAHVEVTLGGTLDRAQRWEFARPKSESPTTLTKSGRMAVWQNEHGAIVACSNDLTTDGSATFEGDVTVQKRSPKTIFLAIAVGPLEEATAAAEVALAAAEELANPVSPPVTKTPLDLPILSTDNTSLDRLFSRSLVHLVMNRWDVPEFVLRPYYATGSVKGGCVCNYLWNFGEVWEILPLLDPAAMRAHIRHFLQCDLTQHFAFDPIEGKAFGPWYPVNQEKIIGLIYYYVLITGDREFLKEPLMDTTIAGLAVQHALVRDDPAKPVALIDYGPSNSHLELRKQYAYNHVMPDLNGRRYENYLRAADIAEWAGAPRPELRERAEQLKAAMAPLWDDEAKWFRFINGEGKPELRYTMQVFKLFNSAVLSPTQVEGLLSHFNEREFFSQYGMHSMSKLDPAYDQVDIDNGGGGACTCFPPQIAERLYKMGRVAEADDILRRILWWGERMPYWGDSVVANEIAYRKDTPLQCTLDGATVAQTIIFGLFGIAPQADGSILVSPRASGLFREGTLLVPGFRKKSLIIEIGAEKTVVTCGDQRWEAARGETVTIPAYRDSPK